MLVEYVFVNDSIKMFENPINNAIREFETRELEKLKIVTNNFIKLFI